MATNKDNHIVPIDRALDQGFFLGDEAVFVNGNDSWRREAAIAAMALFPNEGLKLVAGMMATVNRFALETIIQAPVLVLAMQEGKKVCKARHAQLIAQNFARLYSHDPRLRVIMRHLALPLPMRNFAPAVLALRYWPVIRMLSAMAPPTLAQIIPPRGAGQKSWLRNLAHWLRRSNLRGLPASTGVDQWAAKNIPRKGPPGRTNDVFDFVTAFTEPFNPSWTWKSATERSALWHLALQRIEVAATLARTANITLDQNFDFAPLPNEPIVFQGYLFSPLRSAAALIDEGRAMSHCIWTYAPELSRGQSRFYAMMKRGKRVATIQYTREANSLKFSIAQIKGPANRDVTKNVAEIGRIFPERVRSAFKNDPPL